MFWLKSISLYKRWYTDVDTSTDTVIVYLSLTIQTQILLNFGSFNCFLNITALHMVAKLSHATLNTQL